MVATHCACGEHLNDGGVRRQPSEIAAVLMARTQTGSSTMRTLSPLLLAFATLFSATALQAAMMNKCVINGSVSFQQAPCPSTQPRKDPTLDELNAAEHKRHAASGATKPAVKSAANPVTLTTPGEPSARTPAASDAYRCDGRKHCYQMNSCAEAKFFLSRCPGVQMDGDNDGIPCEDQWCSP